MVLNDSNDTVFRQQRTFNEVGTFQFVAKFFNRASRAEKNFTYQVVSGTYVILYSIANLLY